MTFSLRVALAEGEPTSDTVSGTICLPSSSTPAEAQLLVHGATLNSWYWDPDHRPETYSYVRAATAAGRATVSIDRVGAGKSSRPDPVRLDTEVNAFVVHQVVQALRTGQLGHAFSRVLLVAHSYGASVAITESARHGDVSGLLLTGVLHHADAGFSNFVDSLRPAQEEGGRFADLPTGYLTTAADSRATFYHPATGNAEMIEQDERHKDTFTTAELHTGLDGLALSVDVTVPVLLVIGDRDALFCTYEPGPTTDNGGVADEPKHWPNTCPQIVTVPDTGHNLHLSTTAPQTFALANAWTARDDAGRCEPVTLLAPSVGSRSG